MKGPYSRHFYSEFHKNTLEASRVIVPMVIELVHPESVIDVGCGWGVFLSVFLDNGVEDVVGLDGDWVDRSMLMIDSRDFIIAELTEPLPVDRTFDLALSLEVAEHLPEEAASGFVDSLTKLAPTILFSAAIPYQGGKNHLNEQWPEYWVSLFEQRGFVAIDCIRKRVWNNDRVVFWYSQNTLLFADERLVAGNDVLRVELEATNRSMLSVVHPNRYLPSARAIARVRDRVPEGVQRAMYRLLNKS